MFNEKLKKFVESVDNFNETIINSWFYTCFVVVLVFVGIPLFNQSWCFLFFTFLSIWYYSGLERYTDKTLENINQEYEEDVKLKKDIIHAFQNGDKSLEDLAQRVESSMQHSYQTHMNKFHMVWGSYKDLFMRVSTTSFVFGLVSFTSEKVEQHTINIMCKFLKICSPLFL